ncbi:Carbohydrate-binding family 9 [Thermobaculum terrenum ATCC BAA-798]|uniref:Carbohydrate-binding family 9 n=1 Tax=Thermobaculum terrenum (strain ATCC BAA-798 / CCMEE 7001 / YNP1) TaxID=525904 RepID=D1CI47_THET1|nr:sugar-binding protein [Thermobaculum terrenum]ACZ43418.1 Carbohydrate-binding family 9 [Thermobaculum terrenum ATCC BAA-798]
MRGKHIGRLLAVAAMVATLLGSQGAIPARAVEALFYDDFSTPSPRWVVEGGTWQVQDGYYTGDGGFEDAPEPDYAWVDGIGTNVVITTQVTPLAYVTDHRIGISAHVRGGHTPSNTDTKWSLILHDGTLSLLEEGIAWRAQVPFDYAPDHAYLLKMSISGGRVQGKAWEVGSPEPAGWMVTAEFTTQLGEDGVGLYSGRARARFDFIRVDPGPPNLSLGSDRVGNVFVDGEAAELTATVRDQGGQGGSYTLEYAIQNAYGQSVRQGSESLSLPPGGEVQRTVSVSPSAHGYYSASFELRAGTEVVASASTTLAIVAAPIEGTRPESPWGIGGGGAFIGIRFGEQQARNSLELVHRANIAFTREEIFWESVEPRQGEFHWEVFDPSVEEAHRQGVLIMGLLDYFAPWSVPYGYGGQEGEVDFDTAVRNYANYVYQTVSRYKPGGVLAQQEGWSDGYGIRYWEVWNEPPTFWFGTAEQFGQLVRAASEAIRSADPQATVVVSSGGPEFDQTVIEVAGIEAYDALAIHLYPGPTSPEAGSFVRSVRDTRDFLDRHGGQDVAIWITEMGWDTTGGVSEWEQASYIVRASVQTLAAGSERNFIFTFNYGSEPPGWGIVHPDLTPKISYVAYSTLTHLLEGTRPMGEVPMGSALRAYVFEGGGRSVGVVWSVAEDGELTIDTQGMHLSALDLMNNPTGEHSGDHLTISLTGRPVFLVGEGVTANQMQAMIERGAVSGITPLGIDISQLGDLPTTLPPLEVTVTNRVNVPQSGTVTLSLPPGWEVQDNSLAFGPLAPGEEATLTYRLEEVVTRDDNTYAVTATAALDNGGRVSATENLFVTAVVHGTPTIDGDLSDWTRAAPVHADTADKVVGIPGWTPQDLSATAWTMWDDDYLYFAAKVTDDTFSQPNTDGNIWMGDSVQLFFDTLNDKTTYQDEDDQEWGIALTPDGPEVFRWSGGGGFGYVDLARLAAVRGENGDVTYELAIPLAELAPLRPAPSSRTGFTFLVNDDDGGGREGWISWTPGVGNAWNPSLFSTWTFVESIGQAALRVERDRGKPLADTIAFTLGGGTAQLIVHNHGVTAMEVRFSGGQVLTLSTKRSTGRDTYRIALEGDTTIDVSQYVREGANAMAVRPLGAPGRFAILTVFD